MRTTISINDGLLEDAKRLADSLGTSVSDLIGDALRARLAERQTSVEAPFRLITFGGEGLRPGVTWDAVARLAADDEIERMLAVES